MACKKTIAIIIAIIIVVAFIMIYFSRPPTLMVNDINLGVCDGEPFVYRNINMCNSGRSRLHIYDISPCCGTKIMDEIPAYIEPGASANVLAKINVSSSSVDSEFQRVININTNDPEKPFTKIVIKGSNNSPLKIKSHLNYGYIVPGYSPEVIITFDNRIDPDKVNIVASSPYIIIRNIVVDDQQFKFKLVFDDAMPKSIVNEYLYIKTDYDRNPNFIFPITAVVERGIRVRPEIIMLNKDAMKDQKRALRFMVMDDRWHEFKVESINDNIELKLHKNNDKLYILNCIFHTDVISRQNAVIFVKNEYGDKVQIPVLYDSGE